MAFCLHKKHDEIKRFTKRKKKKRGKKKKREKKKKDLCCKFNEGNGSALSCSISFSPQEPADLDIAWIQPR